MNSKNKTIIIGLAIIVLLTATVPVFALVGSFSYGTTYQLADVTCTGSVTAAKARGKIEIELNNPDCHPQNDYKGKVHMTCINTYNISVFDGYEEGDDGQLSVQIVWNAAFGYTLSKVTYEHFVNSTRVFQNDIT